MPLLIGSELLVSQRNTYWVILNFVIAPLLLTLAALSIVGDFFSFYDTAFYPGLIWKAPLALAVLSGNYFCVTQRESVVGPTLGIHFFSLLSTIFEAVTLIRAFIFCANEGADKVCGGLEVFWLAILGAFAIILFFSNIFAALGLFQYKQYTWTLENIIQKGKARLDYEEEIYQDQPAL